MLKWNSLPLLCLLAAASPLHSGGYVCAVGGGSENYRAWSDAPYRWMVEKSGFGPVLVMHYSEGSAWLENYFKSFGASSAQSLVIGSSAQANDSSAYRHVRASRMIFLRGGDQSRYYAAWKGTLVERAIREVWESGGVVGGTSAGLAILGEVDYTAETPASVTSDEAIANPFLRDITLKEDFLPLVPGVIFDSHFTARVRLGRLAAFMANWRQSRGTELIGLGVDENTAACFEPDGTFTVQGAGSVTVLHANAASGFFCQSGHALSFTDWSFHMLTPGFGYDTRTRAVIQIPAEAAAVQPQWQPPARGEARLLLAGGTSPADMRTSLQKMIVQAGDDSLLLLGGSKAASFGSYLSSSLQFSRFRLVSLDALLMQSDGLAGTIRQARSLLVAGFSGAEIAALFAAPSPVSMALQAATARPEAALMLAGEALPLCGVLRLVNAEIKSSDLLYGQLAAAPGLSLLPSSAWMYSTFVSDDFRENRLGGLYWLLYRDTGLLGLALDKTTSVEWDGFDLQPQSTQPLLVMDLRNVTRIDSSDYRMRSGYPPRQSIGFYGGVLHCQSQQDSSVFDLRTRQWHRTTAVRVGAAGLPTMPANFSLMVFPNPGQGAMVFRIEPAPSAAPVALTIYNIRGQVVHSLQNAAVRGQVAWNGRDRRGYRPPSGHYLAVMQWADKCVRQSFTLLR
jgi:cyanophycinase